MPTDDDEVRLSLEQLDEMMVGRYFDRHGKPLKFSEYITLDSVPEYCRIAEDYLDEGVIRVSTVWLGLNHAFHGGPPLIFETMVFVQATPEQLAERRRSWRKHGFPWIDFPWEDLDQRRYATEEEARAGHAELVRSLTLRVEELEGADREW